MIELHQVSNDERKIFFNEASVSLNIPFPIIEKDFWVVWTLEKLFSLDTLKDHLTFKGGTSLSKIYKLIKRFSEDIDVSIEKEFLGFNTPEKDPKQADSKKKAKKTLDEISKSCEAYVQTQLKTDLVESIANALGHTEGWNL